MREGRSKTFNRRQLTIGLDLGDRFSYYCVLDEAGEAILEQKLPTTREAMKRAFEKMPRSRMALEIGTHSPWVSRVNRAGARRHRRSCPERALDRRESP